MIGQLRAIVHQHVWLQCGNFSEVIFVHSLLIWVWDLAPIPHVLLQIRTNQALSSLTSCLVTTIGYNGTLLKTCNLSGGTQNWVECPRLDIFILILTCTVNGSLTSDRPTELLTYILKAIEICSHFWTTLMTTVARLQEFRRRPFSMLTKEALTRGEYFLNWASLFSWGVLRFFLNHHSITSCQSMTISWNSH